VKYVREWEVRVCERVKYVREGKVRKELLTIRESKKGCEVLEKGKEYRIKEGKEGRKGKTI
jgi:hypothetical protein